MNDELLASIEREVLGWPGVWRKRDEDGPGGSASLATGSGSRRSDMFTTTGTPTSGSRGRSGTSCSGLGESSHTLHFRAAGRRRVTGSGARQTCPKSWNSSA
jgi:hypothetical protein